LGVELVRVVENGRFGGSRGGPVVVARDGVEELGEHSGIDVARTLLDRPQSEVDVTEQATFLRLTKRRAASELSDATHIVKERCGEQEVVAKPRVELRSLATEGRDTDRVLEQPSRIAVMPVGARGGERPKSATSLRVADERVDHGGKAFVGDLRCDELEEAVELVGVSAQRRRQRRWIRILCRLHGPHLDLELAPEALDPTEHVHGVAFAEPLVEEIDVVPHSCFHAPARVGQLEGEIGGPCASAPPLLLRHCEHAFDGPVLGELGDRGHVPSLWRKPVGTLAAMADTKPFRAVRYSGAAGSLADLVAPPYDAVDDVERSELYTRSAYNVVHVTLPESVDEAGRLYREWLAQGILTHEDEPQAWLTVERYVGPDGVSRERSGVIVSLAAEPYETGSVLPHERTHPRIRDERLRLLRATRVQPEPILVLAEASIGFETPTSPPALEVDGTRLWPVAAPPSPDLGQLLIADGHHRYESAVELGAEAGEGGVRIMALVVSKDDAGLHVFPTHRVFAHRPDLEELREGEPCSDLDEALLRLGEEPYETPAVIAYRRESVEFVRGREDELDVDLVDRHGLEGIAYTPRRDDAVAAVDRGAADVAFLLRGQRVGDIFDLARRGERMPPKSTYFFPKPLSGLLFHPLDR
jgi:uncharacterized protein (DUF1015 family)